MSAWKDEYKNRWTAELRQERDFQLLDKTVKRQRRDTLLDKIVKRQRRDTRVNQFLNGIYYALTAAVIIAVIWFALFLFGVVPG